MSGSPSREFIDLDRTFLELSNYARQTDEADISEAFRTGPSMTWAHLKTERRVVLLAEAGAGKTREIRQAAARWRADGNHAFFLRLEHIADDLGIAFEVGDVDQFERWKSSSDEGWVLLDSVDEARLRGPKDFERAILNFAKHIRGAEERLHVLITSRTSAWRPRTDLQFCERHLPAPATGRLAVPDQQQETSDASSDVNLTSRQVSERPQYRIVTLEDLDQTRIRKFAEASEVDGLGRFLEAIDRRDAWAYTRRPQDLVELIEFWRSNGRIGSRLDLISSSVERRLAERDQARAEWQPLAMDRMRAAAARIAAACILTHEATIQVPDGSASGSGLHLANLLPEWDARELHSLLSRPLFDEAIYGAVRFHHREAREYLAAEWFGDLLRRETSRTRIEALFFRRQYDLEVITPNLRSVLPWLALLDDRIRERLLRIAPQVLFEGGDPSQLPRATREAILRECCRGLVEITTPRTFTDYATIQRFAAPDLVETIRDLLRVYANSDEVTSFLCRMIWIGPLPELRPEARALALCKDTSAYTRIVAIRALAAIGASDALLEVRQTVLEEDQPIDREFLAELVTATLLGADDVRWLSAALRAAATPRAHAVDRVAEVLKGRIEGASSQLLRALIRAFGEFLAEAPLVNTSYCPVSQDWMWLTVVSGLAATSLIARRDAVVLEEASLALLRLVGLARQHLTYFAESTSRLTDLVKRWDTLNRNLFWHEVAASRLPSTEKNARPVTNVSHVWPRTSFWGFDATHFDYFIEQLSARPDPDDRAVALSAALEIFDSAGRPEPWRHRLIAGTTGAKALEAALRNFFSPPPETKETKAWKRQEKAWALKAEKAKLKQARNREEWREGLRSEVELLRESGLVHPPRVSHSQWYLLDHLREADSNSNHWTDGNWEVLVAEFGIEVAEAFRNGARGFWRRYDPLPRSEGAVANSTPGAHVFGLAGLAIEAREDQEWAARLSPDEAVKAVRYAIGELNGFPVWLPRLFAAHPHAVLRVLMGEVEHQVREEKLDESYHYVLDDVSSSGTWCWGALGPLVVSMLGDVNPRRPASLEKLLVIVHGSGVSDEVIAKLSASGIDRSTSIECRAIWFAALVGADPERGMPQLRKYLNGLNDLADRTQFAMHVVTNLVGGRTGRGIRARNNFVVPQHLADLYMLMHEHIRRGEDINRVGIGVYSPELRDDAQNAREGLLGLLGSIPGKAAFLAFSQLAAIHPEKSMRPYLMQHAARRAEADADLLPWHTTQVLDFGAKLERTPQDHRELADLVLLRFLDLKAELEGGDESLAPVLLRVREETEMRNFLARELRSRAQGRYHLPQESELADGKRPDLRFHGNGFDAPVPTELKLADRWSGPKLLERLENQLCGDYLRDPRSRRGFFVLVHNGTEKAWTVEEGLRVDFEGLIKALEAHWRTLAANLPEIDDVQVVGINLPLRAGPAIVEAIAAPHGQAGKKQVDRRTKTQQSNKRSGLT